MKGFRCYLRVGLRGRQVVVYLSGIWHSFQASAHSRERSGDEVGGALLTHPKHHGGSHIEGVPLPVIVSCTPSWYDVPGETDRALRIAGLGTSDKFAVHSLPV